MVCLVLTALLFHKFFQRKNMCHNFHFAYVITAIPPNTQSFVPPLPTIIHKHLRNILLGNILMFMKKGELIIISFYTKYKLQENQNFHTMNKRSSHSLVFCEIGVVGNLFSGSQAISA